LVANGLSHGRSSVCPNEYGSKCLRMSDSGGDYVRRKGRWPANVRGVTEMEL
jgi:hypothetical protein